jgi:hypothetical protein
METLLKRLQKFADVIALQIHPYQDGQVRPFKEVEEFVPQDVFVPYVTYK